MDSSQQVRVSPVKHVNGNRNSISSSKQHRARRVKRSIRRQQRSDETSRSSFTDSLVASLANVAQAFLYPEDAIRVQQTDQRNNDATTNTSALTVEMTDEDDDNSDEARFDVRTPPPALAVSSALSASVKRPIPVSSPLGSSGGGPVSSSRSGFNPVFPADPFRDLSPSAPIARMRAPPPPHDDDKLQSSSAAAQPLSPDEQSRYSENFVADKHRKWRRQIKLQKKRLQQERRQRQDDDTSLLTACGPIEGKGSRRRGSKDSKKNVGEGRDPVDIFAALIRAPCADVEDVVTGCHEGLASSDEEDEHEQDENSSLVGRHDDDESTQNDRQSEFTGLSEYTASECDRESEFTDASEYTDGPRSEFSGATSEYTDDRRSEFTGVTSEYTDDRESEFTGVSEYTDASLHLRLSELAQKASSSSAVQIKSISPSSSSVRTETPTLPPQNSDNNFIKTFITELTREGMLLIWHGPHSDSTAFRRPCGVVAHLSVGTPLDGMEEAPLFVWHKQDGSNGGVIDLFDIQSMETASLDMLESYHFAIPDNTFFVVLNNGNQVVFEASSEKEAKRFIHGLRWVVARMSYNLVVGNPLVLAELLSADPSRLSSPRTPLEEALWSNAMNDVTNSLVDKSLVGKPVAKVTKSAANRIYDDSLTSATEDDSTVEELSNLCVD